MVEGFSKINHKGKEIYFMDFSKFAADPQTQKEKTIRLRQDATKEYLGKEKLSVLTLLNITDLHFDMDILKVFKEEVSKVDPYEKKSAIVGVKGLLKVGYNFVVGLTTQKKVQLFDTLEQAKDWLVE